MDELAQVLRHVKTTSADPALLVGLDAPDDAAVYRLADGLAIVQTVDFFTPIVDDAYAWGRIAAANALSDVYAMGARPRIALSLVSWPRSLDLELLGRVLDGAGGACDEAGVDIVGGHSVDDPEPKFGLAVTGVVDPDRVVRKTGARPGDELVLTKPLGMGIISSGIKAGATSDATVKEATRVMSTLNRAAAEAMGAVGVSAATDVTGFGLLGHLLQMLDSETSAALEFGSIPLLEEALQLAADGIFPGGSRRNLEAVRDRVDFDGLEAGQRAVLVDAQTSGGLLIAVAPERCEALLDALVAAGVDEARRVGAIVAGDGRVRVRAT